MHIPLALAYKMFVPQHDPLPAPIKLTGVELAKFLRDKGTDILAAKMAVSESGYYTATIRQTNPPELCVEDIHRDQVFGPCGGNRPSTCIRWAT